MRARGCIVKIANQHCKKKGNNVAEKLPTPICEVSGLPLPVLPIEPREIGALSINCRLVTDHNSAWLPPREVWLEDIFDQRNKIHAPTDSNGLVDRAALIDKVKSKFDPEYRWSRLVLSVHHEYWNKAWYGFESAGPNAMIFRELPINKVLLPRIFENVIHQVVYQPDIPDQDIMDEVIDSFNVTDKLFRSIQSAVRRQRGIAAYSRKLERQGLLLPPEFYEEDEAGQKILIDSWEQHFPYIDRAMQKLEEVPTEFRLIDPDKEALRSEEGRRRYSGTLGRIIVPRAMAMTRPLVAAA